MKTTSLRLTLLLTIVSALVFARHTSFSQDAGPRSHLGVKAGFNASNMYTNEVDDSNLKIGMHIGFFAKIALTENIAFQPEFIYTMKGAELVYRNSFVTGSATFALDYLEIPLLLVFNLTENLNFHGGVYVSSLSKVRVSNESDIDLFNFENEMNDEDFESIDYGLVIGAGSDFEAFSIGLRYDYGVRTVGKERSFLGTSYRFPDARNSTWQFYVALNLL
jgi:hypothetical protein